MQVQDPKIWGHLPLVSPAISRELGGNRAVGTYTCNHEMHVRKEDQPVETLHQL